MGLLPFLKKKNKNQIESRAIDADGNVYQTVIIDHKEWMAENLNVKTFRNGDPILEAKTDQDWESAGLAGKPVWCYYKNEPALGEKYGKLYNWYAVNDKRGLAPSGWHVLTRSEWTTLILYLGGERVAGGKLKETGTMHWRRPNKRATNKTGFSALPGGFRHLLGSFNYNGQYGYWWCATASTFSTAWMLHLYYNIRRVAEFDLDKRSGCSVRCIRE